MAGAMVRAIRYCSSEWEEGDIFYRVDIPKAPDIDVRIN